jgi:hypothetical protein
MLETVALVWCYCFGAVVAIGLLAIAAIWATDKVLEYLKLSRAIIDFLWARAKQRAEDSAP